jgi:hypothetical protein
MLRVATENSWHNIVSYFSKFCYPATFQDLTIGGSSVAVTSQVCVSILFLPYIGSYKARELDGI